jgi:hypothetical protein
VKFEARIKELVENLPDMAVLIEPLLIVRRALREQIVILHQPSMCPLASANPSLSGLCLG